MTKDQDHLLKLIQLQDLSPMTAEPPQAAGTVG